MHHPIRSLYSGVTSPLFAICLVICLLWTQMMDVAAAPIAQTTETPISAAINETTTAEPLDCINPLKNGHIAASIASLIPIPFFKDAADLAAYGLNLELKNCPPHLVPANNLAYQPPQGECRVDLRMPIAVNYNALTQLDAEIIAEVMNDPELREIPGLKAELEEQLKLEYGRFTHETYGSYINIYGIQLPLNLSEFAANDWGTVGRPAIYHYNSDVLITLRHPGERLNTEYVRFFAGSNGLSWKADTLLSPFDYLYIPNFGGAAAAGKRAGKEGVVQALKNAIKAAIKEASEQGAKEFSKKIAKEIAKDVAKRVGFKALATVTRVAQPYFVGGSPNVTTYRTQYVMVIDIKFDLLRGYIYVVTNNGASNFSFITVYRINRTNAAPFEVVDSFDMMNEIEHTPEGRLVKFFDANEAIADANGLLYAMSREPAQGLALFQPTGDERKPLKLVTHLVYNHTSDVDESGLNLRFLSSMALDSQGNLYVFGSHPTTGENGPLWPRIYKFAAATIDSEGNVQAGALIGWLGKCDSGPNCDYINGRSIGYSCTDDTCLINAGNSGSGSRAGQFNTNSSTFKNVAIAIDPNDVLYVADYENSRVQRFSPEGAVAGEANSVGDGSSFVLGDFGTPDNIAVNKSSFYILDQFNEIVHVFDAAVIHGIDEVSAWVEYQSDANYVGADSFTFAATDGFRTVNEFSGETELLKSAPATVALNVSRNHRPPQAAVGLSFTTTEDTPGAVTLQGNDLDNFGVPRDQLTFQVVRQPLGGTLSGSGANLTYTPDADFTGEDSFTFTVRDDRFTSEPETVVLLVTPVNDAPVVIPESTTLRGGAGYPLTLRATVVDAEADDTHTMQVDWGDGTVESEGQIGGDSLPTGPILIANDTFTSTLTAFHTYRAAGSYTLKVTATDASGAKGEATVAVTVEPMADLALTRQGSNVVSANRPTLSYELLVTHNAPSSGGISATNVNLRETLGSGLRYRLAAPDSGTCTPNGQTLTCTLGALAAGATNRIRIVVDAATDLAVGTEVTAFSTVEAATADPIAENNTFDGKVTMLHAADFLVDNFREGIDANPGDGLCATAQGVCTVRAAIQEANALPGKQTIALARGVYLLNIFPAGNRPTVDPSPENNGVTGDLDITGDLEILGLNADQTTLHANNGDRVIETLNGAKVLIRDVMLTGGLPLPLDNSGGALRNSGGDVTLQRVTMTGNAAPNGGGAIHNQRGTLRVEASALVGNMAGAVESQTVGRLDGGTVGSGAAGGGILNEGTLTLVNVTVSGNQAERGGGLAVTSGTVVVTNGTIYANSATANGGGIWTNSDSVRIGNTILAGNSAGVTGPDCTAQVRSDGHNLLSNLTDCTILGTTATNIIEETVGLAALAAADGETYGHTLLESSRAVDAGSCALATDQRGVERPQGAGCDIGALELGGMVVVSTLYLPVVAR